MKKQQICILGSTGSIGTQALDVIEQHSDLYEVYCLTANNRVDELASQARKFHPAAVVIANEAHYDRLKDLLSDEPDIKVYAGAQALCDIVEAGPSTWCWLRWWDSPDWSLPSMPSRPQEDMPCQQGDLGGGR